MDADGTESGYDLDLISTVAEKTTLPIVASGGAGSPEHMISAVNAGAGAVLAASIFHFGEYSIAEVKHMMQSGIPVRLVEPSIRRAGAVEAPSEPAKEPGEMPAAPVEAPKPPPVADRSVAGRGTRPATVAGRASRRARPASQRILGSAPHSGQRRARRRAASIASHHLFLASALRIVY